MKVISIIGEKKSGKTSLIESLIAYLKEYGKVGCIKHAHELDLAAATAKDTDRFFNAGAEVVIGASPEKTVKICGSGKKNLEELIAEMATSGVDFVLVEGFKSSDVPKIALSDFSKNQVSAILKRVDFRGNPQMKEEMIKELVQLILSLEDY
jgi:molybdopterin synthase catalytic subunit